MTQKELINEALALLGNDDLQESITTHAARLLIIERKLAKSDTIAQWWNTVDELLEALKVVGADMVSLGERQVAIMRWISKACDELQKVKDE